MTMSAFKRNARIMFFTGLATTMLGLTTMNQAGTEPNPEKPDKELMTQQHEGGKRGVLAGFLTMAGTLLAVGFRGAARKNDSQLSM